MKNKKLILINGIKKKNKRNHRLTKLERTIRNKQRIEKYSPHQNYSAYISKIIFDSKHTEIIRCCKDFRLIENPQDVIRIISNIKSLDNIQGLLEVVIDLEGVELIDIGAISLMLSSVKELSYKRIKVSGTTPKSNLANSILIKSGFFSNISNVTSRLSNTMNSDMPKNKNRLILADCNTKRKGELVGTNIKRVISYLTGEENHYKPLYTILMEMNANAFEHAYKDTDKHWVLGINYQEDKNVAYFTFTDNGLGIINQLNLRKRDRVLRFINDFVTSGTSDVFNNGFLLLNVFDKKYNSRFKEQNNRNRGLPIIKEKNIKGKVNNLICVTNNVYLNFEKEEYIILNSSFSGTFYYWELNKENLTA